MARALSLLKSDPLLLSTSHLLPCIAIVTPPKLRHALSRDMHWLFLPIVNLQRKCPTVNVCSLYTMFLCRTTQSLKSLQTQLASQCHSHILVESNPVLDDRLVLTYTYISLSAVIKRSYLTVIGLHRKGETEWVGLNNKFSKYVAHLHFLISKAWSQSRQKSNLGCKNSQNVWDVHERQTR